MSDTPFSGVGGVVHNVGPVDPKVTSMIDLLNRLGVQRYIVDVNGSPTEMSFSNGTLTIVGGGSTVTYPYKRA